MSLDGNDVAVALEAVDLRIGQLKRSNGRRTSFVRRRIEALEKVSASLNAVLNHCFPYICEGEDAPSLPDHGDKTFVMTLNAASAKFERGQAMKFNRRFYGRALPGSKER